MLHESAGHDVVRRNESSQNMSWTVAGKKRTASVVKGRHFSVPTPPPTHSSLATVPSLSLHRSLPLGRPYPSPTRTSSPSLSLRPLFILYLAFPTSPPFSSVTSPFGTSVSTLHPLSLPPSLPLLSRGVGIVTVNGHWVCVVHVERN